MCDLNTDCFVNCNQEQSCHNQIINGSLAASLTVLCNSNELEGCLYFTKIDCPKRDRSSGLCNITSLNDSSYVDIYGFNSNDNSLFISNIHINMSCSTNCSIYANYSHAVNITSTYFKNSYIDANYSTNFNMICNSGGCENIFVHIHNVNDIVNISCQSVLSCVSMLLYADNTKKLLLTGNGSASDDSVSVISASTVFARNVSYFELNLIRGIGSSDNHFYIPSDNKIYLKCIGNGCSNMNMYNDKGFGENVINESNICFNGNSDCESVSDCIDKWDLHCDGSVDSLTDQCDSIQCNCDDLKETLTDSFINTHNSHQCNLSEKDDELLTNTQWIVVFVSVPFVLLVIIVIIFICCKIKRKSANKQSMVSMPEYNTFNRNSY